MGRLRRPHHRRNGPRLGKRNLHHRRRLQGIRGQAPVAAPSLPRPVTFRSRTSAVVTEPRPLRKWFSVSHCEDVNWSTHTLNHRKSTIFFATLSFTCRI